MKAIKNILSITLMPLLMLSLQQCDESSPQPKPLTELEKLPLATQSGKHTFGCLVDGKAWVTKLAGDSQGFYQAGNLSISASVHTDLFDGIMSIHIVDQDLSKKSYELAEQALNGNYIRYYDFKNSCELLTTTTHVGTVFITHLDTQNFTVSGNFQFDIYSESCNKILSITDGRFDINYVA